MVAKKVDNKVEGEYSSSGSGGLIEKLAKSKNFKNLKFKNHRMYGRI